MSTQTGRDAALDRAIELAGGVAALAKFITEHQEDITTQAISQWRRCPPDRALIVEQATDGRVTRHDLRSDIFGPAPKPERKRATAERAAKSR